MQITKDIRSQKGYFFRIRQLEFVPQMMNLSFFLMMNSSVTDHGHDHDLGHHHTENSLAHGQDHQFKLKGSQNLEVPAHPASSKYLILALNNFAHHCYVSQESWSLCTISQVCVDGVAPNLIDILTLFQTGLFIRCDVSLVNIGLLRVE